MTTKKTAPCTCGTNCNCASQPCSCCGPNCQCPTCTCAKGCGCTNAIPEKK